MIVKFSKIISAVLAAFSVISNAQAQIPGPEVFGALPDVVEVAVSPDGGTLAMLHNVNGKSAVFFVDIDNPDGAPGGIRVGGANTRDIQWVDNDHLLVLASISDRVRTTQGLEAIEFFRWLSVSKSRQEAVSLFGNTHNVFLPSPGFLASTLPDDPEHALFFRPASEPKKGVTPRAALFDQDYDIYYSVLKTNLDDGRIELVELGEENTIEWIVGPDGAVAARIDYDRAENMKRVFTPKDNGSYELAVSMPYKRGRGSKLNLLALKRAPNLFYAAGYRGGTRQLFEYDIQGGVAGAPLFRHSKFDLDGYSYDPESTQITAAWYIDDLPRHYSFDAGERRLEQAIESAVPGAAAAIVSKSDDGQRVVAELTYSNNPKQFYLFDRTNNRLHFIATTYNALDGKTLAAKQRFDYTASDGQNIPGYLTVPRAYSSGVDNPGPLIVLPHGGPESRADQAYDYWSFFYASQGYYVYEPNFRGSYGYGETFREAGFGEWGRRMQQDITDGVEKLIADGIADPKRICIVGGSYGGYAALAGATLTPDLYTCAVSINGVSALKRMLITEARGSELSEDYWKIRIGDRKKSSSEIAAVSPANLADEAGAPILLIHSIDDAVVPIRQSIEMRSALRRAGKPFEYVELKGEDHWLSSSETRIEMLERSIAFIDEHIGR